MPVDWHVPVSRQEFSVIDLSPRALLTKLLRLIYSHFVSLERSLFGAGIAVRSLLMRGADLELDATVSR